MKAAIDPKEKEELLYGRGRFSPSDNLLDYPEGPAQPQQMDEEQELDMDAKSVSQGERRLIIQAVTGQEEETGHDTMSEALEDAPKNMGDAQMC